MTTEHEKDSPEKDEVSSSSDESTLSKVFK